eukprot:jgi/Tetstr1/429402/TSEL_019313.t1
MWRGARDKCARCVQALSASQPAASEFYRQWASPPQHLDGLAVVGEEALVSAVTEVMHDRLNNYHMQGGLKPATATFRGVPTDPPSSRSARHDRACGTQGPRHSPRRTKKVRYMTTCRERVESVAVFLDVHGGALKDGSQSHEACEEGAG